MPGGVYPQRFGIPEGLYAEPVAVKQGWMCCWIGANWMHLSTGVIGPDRRYVMAIGSMQPADDADRPRHHHPGRQDDVPRRPDLVVQQIGPALAGALQRLFASPRRDLGVVTGQQHLGHVEPAPARRPGVARPLQQAVGMRIVLV